MPAVTCIVRQDTKERSEPFPTQTRYCEKEPSGSLPMDYPKKILILYASAGHGHEKAAKAILEACRESGATNVRAVDTLSLASRFFGSLYRQTYLLQIKYAPWLWGAFYYTVDVGWVYAVMRRMRRLMNGLTAKRLEQLIVEE